MIKQRGSRHFRRQSALSAACAVEALETRRLLASTIEGLVFHDYNRNGVYNPGQNEVPAQNYRVFLDTNGNDQFDEGIDPFVFTDANGRYAFGGLDPNTTYRVVVDHRDVEITSTAREQDVQTGPDGSTVEADDFGIQRSRINGRVFVDLNGNGEYDLGEGLGPVRVFIDMNDNGILDEGDEVTWTTSTFLGDGVTPNPNAGNYIFNHVDGGQHKIYVWPAHYQSVDGDNPQVVTVNNGALLAGVNFILENKSAIGGIVFNDVNGNGTRDPGEQLIANARVYLDVNKNGQFDIGEPSALSTADGSTGINYVIERIEPGNYTVRVDLPDGYASSNPGFRDVTVTAGMETTSTSFGLVASASGPAVPNDFNGDGKSDIIVTQNNVSTVWFMDGVNRLGTASLPNFGAGFALAGYGDFDGDGKPDLLVHNAATGAAKIILLNGTSLKGTVNLPSANTAWKPVGVGDFNNDGHLDIVWRNQVTGQNTTWRMNGTTVSQFKALPSAGNLNWTIAGIGDFNNDGFEDIVWRNKADGRNTTWLLGPGNALTFKALPSTGDQNWQVAAISKFNNDDRPDILWIHAQTGNNIVWLLNASGQPTFSKVVI